MYEIRENAKAFIKSRCPGRELKGAKIMKRTNVVLDEKLINRAKSLTGIKTLRLLVDYALRDLLRHRRQRDILKLRGRINWEGDLSAIRAGRKFS